MIFVAETLWWARSVDEGFQELVGQAYVDKRAEAYEGQHVIGLRYARNRAGHQQASLIDETGLAAVQLPIGSSALTWRPVAELPAGRPDTAGKEAYVKRLEGRLVRNAFDSAAQWFTIARDTWPDKLGVTRFESRTTPGQSILPDS